MANNISIKINLKGLKNAFIKKMKKKDGSMIDVLVIPVVDNHLFVSDKGAYLDLEAFEFSQAGKKETHLVKQSLPKEVYKAMSEDQRKTIPLLGNCIAWGGASDTTQPSYHTQQVVNAPSSAPDDDDLPF